MVTISFKSIWNLLSIDKRMSKCKKELSEKERERLLIRRASGANASQLAHMEKMLQETKGLLEKKTEADSEIKACGDTMGMCF